MRYPDQLLILLVAAFIVLPPIALAVSVAALVRIKRLSRKIQTWETAEERGKPVPLSEEAASALSQLTVRVTQLEGEVRGLRSTPINLPVRPSPLPSSPSRGIPDFSPTLSHLELAQPVSASVPEQALPDLELVWGLSWMNKIGVLALLFGVSFFLKYAFDNHWIGETGRVALGLLSGGILLFIGDRCFRKKYYVFAHALMGGGMALLYLSTYAAFAFYHVIPQGPAFGIMIGVTATVVILSLLHQAAVIAFLGLVGGFLTPILLSTGVDHQISFFSYIALLDVTALAVASFQDWKVLNYTAFAGTAFLFAGWYGKFYNEFTNLVPTFLFLTLFFVFFLILPFWHALFRRVKVEATDLLLFLLNALLYFGVSYALLNPYHHTALVFLTFGLSGLYLLYTRLIFLYIPQDKYALMASLGASLTFLTLAIPIYLSLRWITLGWALEGTVVLYLGLRYRDTFTRVLSCGIFLLVLGRLLFIDFGSRSSSIHVFMLNGWFLIMLASIFPFFLAAYLYQKIQEGIDLGERKVGGAVFGVVAHLLLLALLSTEIWLHVNYEILNPEPYTAHDVIHNLELFQKMSLSILWALYAFVLLVWGVVRQNKGLRVLALVILSATIVKVFFSDIWALEKIYRIISFIGLGVVLLVGSYFYHAFTRPESEMKKGFIRFFGHSSK